MKDASRGDRVEVRQRGDTIWWKGESARAKGGRKNKISPSADAKEANDKPVDEIFHRMRGCGCPDAAQSKVTRSPITADWSLGSIFHFGGTISVSKKSMMVDAAMWETETKRDEGEKEKEKSVKQWIKKQQQDKKRKTGAVKTARRSKAKDESEKSHKKHFWCKQTSVKSKGEKEGEEEKSQGNPGTS